MPGIDDLKSVLKPVLDVVMTVDVDDEQAKRTLDERLPVDGEAVSSLRHTLRRGIDEGWLCDKAPGGVPWTPVAKATDEDDVSIDVVHMDGPGPGHTHPRGEIDLCLTVSGTPRFDGHGEGWVVYPSGSWHIPAVDGGAMDIVYFLPGGAIRFGPKA